MNQVQAAEQIDPIREYRIPMTDIEFENDFSEGKFAEWANGEAIIFVSPTPQHQRISAFLNMLLGIYIGALHLGELLYAPLAMRINPNGSIREPDLLFISNEHIAYWDSKRLNGPADLVVEIISAESVARDRSDKFYEYQNGGVREYWVIDPRPGMTRADFWVLDETNRFRPIPIDADGIYHSTVLPNFWLDVNSLLAEKLPDPLIVVGKLMGEDAMRRAFGLDR